MHELKVRAIGNSRGVTLPKEVTDRLNIKEGDTLFLTETRDGYHLSVYNPRLARKLEIAKRFMRENRDLMKALADA